MCYRMRMYIKVYVAADAKNESFVQEGPVRFRITVREEAARNMANTRVRELIAAHFGVVVGAVRIVNGHHSPSKLLAVDDTIRED